ncbi:hypothetical protein KXV92_007648, partial [Aspergillus fumigatus]
MQTIVRELSVELSASHRDSEEDFRTLFGESTDSNKPIPSLTWVENELAAMDMGNPSQPSCDAQDEYHSDELLLRDISIPGPSEQASARRRSPRKRTGTVNKRPYINFVTHAPDLAKCLREAQSDRKALEERGAQSTAAYRQLSR